MMDNFECDCGFVYVCGVSFMFYKVTLEGWFGVMGCEGAV